MNNSCFIPDDGYTQESYIAEIPRLHGSLRFKYRPVLVEIRSEHLAKEDSLAPAAFNGKTAKIMAQQILEWSVTDPAGKPVAVTPENILRLQPMVFIRLSRIIFGTSPGDEDPAAKADEPAEKFPSALANQEADLKN